MQKSKEYQIALLEAALKKFNWTRIFLIGWKIISKSSISQNLENAMLQ